MQNIKATGKKFLVEMKNDSGEYEPLGVLSFHDAVQMQFTTNHSIRMQRVSDLDEREGELVGKQLFTRGELRKALIDLVEAIKPEMNAGESIGLYDLRNGYSTTEKRDLCENQWPHEIMAIDFDAVYASLIKVDARITEGNLEVYFNDMEGNSAYCENHGIWITDGKITKVY
jgi:hypothetical protein